jgi:hypothetical protein
MSNGTIIGTILNVTERGEYRTVLVQREAADDYERKHEDKTVLPFELTPYLFKRNGVAALLRPGRAVAVTYHLVGSLGKTGMRFLKAAIDSIESAGGASADEPGAAQTDPTGAAADGQAEDTALPF